MSALLAPKQAPTRYLHTVELQDALRAEAQWLLPVTVPALAAEKQATESVWVEVFLVFLTAAGVAMRFLSRLLDAIQSEIDHLEAQIKTVKESLCGR